MPATPLSFMGLLTAQEQTGIAAAALQSPPLLVWLIKLAAAQYVDPADPQMQAGIAAMVATGLISQERAAALAAALARDPSAMRRVAIVDPGAANPDGTWPVVSVVELSPQMEISGDHTGAFGWNEHGAPAGYRPAEGQLLYETNDAQTGDAFDHATGAFLAAIA
jgi:hypothetical protein